MKTRNFPAQKNARRIAARERAMLRLDSGRLLTPKSFTKQNPEADKMAICLLDNLIVGHNEARAIRTKIRRSA